MVTSFLRIQAAISDMVFEPLINLLNDPIAELDQYPEAFRTLFSGLLQPGEFLVFPCAKLANWLVPESFEGQYADFTSLEACNDVQLWDAELDCWKYRKILAFAKVDFDYCLVCVNLEQGSLSMSVFSTAYDLSRFWNSNTAAALDYESSEHFNQFSSSLAAWLGLLSAGHFQASGQAMLGFSNTQTPMLDLLKQTLSSLMLFPELPYVEIGDQSTLAYHLGLIAQQRAELAAIQQEDEEDADSNPPSEQNHCYKRFNEYSDSIMIVRPQPLEEINTSAHIAAENTQIIGVTKKLKKLVRRYVKCFPAITSVPIIVLYLCPQQLTHSEIINVALELGFPLKVNGTSPEERSAQKLKLTQAIQATFLANGRQKKRDCNGVQSYNNTPNQPAREVFLTEHVRLSNYRGAKKPIVTRTLTPYGRQKAREYLGFAPFEFYANEATTDNLLELICKTLLEHGSKTAAEIVTILQEQGSTVEKKSVDQTARLGVRQNILSSSEGTSRSPLIFRVRKRKVKMMGGGPAPLPLPIVAEVETNNEAEPVVLELPNIPNPDQGLQDELRSLFEQKSIVSISECLVLLSATANATMGELREALELLTQHKFLYKLANPKSASHDLFLRRGTEASDQLEFEYFYSLIKDFGLDEQQSRNFALHRAAAYAAYLSGDVTTNAALRTTWELITAPEEPSETAAVRVFANVGPLSFLGNGLFANTDLPQGLLIPVDGVQHLDSELPEDLFLPYGFKFQSFLPGRESIVVDTCPGGPQGSVTCWAGFVNDPLNTGFSANAVPVCSNFENQMYLKLVKAMPAGQQIFWDYGVEYWEEVSRRQQEEEKANQQPFDNLDMSVFDNFNTAAYCDAIPLPEVSLSSCATHMQAEQPSFLHLSEEPLPLLLF